jgi:hypothetical protein
MGDGALALSWLPALLMVRHLHCPGSFSNLVPGFKG